MCFAHWGLPNLGRDAGFEPVLEALPLVLLSPFQRASRRWRLHYIPNLAEGRGLYTPNALMGRPSLRPSECPVAESNRPPAPAL